jgi:hypothetical protein
MDSKILGALDYGLIWVERRRAVNERTTLRSSNGPYIDIGRLTKDDRRETKCTRAFRGIGVTVQACHGQFLD